MKETEKATFERDGFRGFLYRAPGDRCMIVVLGDEGNDRMDTACASWLTQQGISALCVAMRQKKENDTGVHQWPIETLETAVRWLRGRGYAEIGIFGMSMQASLALTAASLLPEISLVVALSPNDFVPWGFYHGKLGNVNNAEWPSGTSAFSWRGKELPYQPAYLEKEAYWALYSAETKKYKEMHSKTVFENSEATAPISEECYISVEKIRGQLVLVGAEDDSMWASTRYIRRMENRLREAGFAYPVDAFLYPVGTHLLVPEGLLKKFLPIGGGLISRMYASGRKHPKECRQARQDLDERLTDILKNW